VLSAMSFQTWYLRHRYEEDGNGLAEALSLGF